jgi:hypothetical protein
MPSPFPGMNPYLEQEGVWQDFHQSFILAVRQALSPQVRPAYMVKIEEALFIHELSAEERQYLGRADVSVTRNPAGGGMRSAGTLLEAPVYGRVPVAVDIERHSYLEIRDRSSRELIAVIELLSPSNKRNGPDHEQYLAKRWQLLSSPAHFVELDLLRGGPRLPLEDLPGCDYYALVSRAEERPRVGIWPFRLRDPLPLIPIPLRPSDPDARLDLQQVLHHVYDDAGYEDYIYTGAPQPLLQPADAAWARELTPKRSEA